MLTNHKAAYAGALVGALAVWIILTYPWLSGAVTIPYDAKAHFQAQLQFLAGSLHTGQSPFWAPHVFAGSPQIADPQSLIFSPAFLLAYFDASPSLRDLDIYVLALLGLGGLAIFMLGRDKGWYPAGAMLAATTFAFGASAAWRIQHIGQVQSLALFAIALWLLERALDRSSCGYGIAAGVAAGLMIVEPDQVALLASYVLAGRVVAHWVMSGNPRFAFRRSAMPLISGAGVGFAISGLPLLMTYLFADASSRPAIPFEEAIRGSLHPASLLTVLIGDLFGARDPKVEYWGPSSAGWGDGDLSLSQNMGEVYLGALPALAIFTIGITRGLLWQRDVRFYTVAWLLVLSYALGRYTPVFGIAFDYLPVVDAFRRPADATFVVGALMALQAGYICHCCATGMIPPAPRWIKLVECCFPAIPFIVALCIAVQFGRIDTAWKPMLSAAGWCAASAVALGLIIVIGRRHPLLTTAIIAALVTADLSVNNGPNESTALTPERYDFLLPDTRNETVRLLKDKLRRSPGSPWRDRVELVGLGYEWPNVPLIHGFDHVLGNNPLRLKVLTEAVGAGDTIAGPDQRHFTTLFPSYRSLLSNMMGLRIIASSIPIEQVDRRLAPGDLRLIARTGDA